MVEMRTQGTNPVEPGRVAPAADPSARRVLAVGRAWRLTGRQGEVFRLLSAGQSNKEIAAALHVAPATVERHVTSILVKAGCRRRAELIARLWAAPIEAEPGGVRE